MREAGNTGGSHLPPSHISVDRELAAFDRLPRAVRDALNYAPDCLCAASIAAAMRAGKSARFIINLILAEFGDFIGRERVVDSLKRQ